MKLNFNITYKTVFGEELVLNIVSKDSENSTQTLPFRMSTFDGVHWTYQMMKPQSSRQTVLDYFYSVDCEGSERRHEWTTLAHRLDFSAVKGVNYAIYDHWIDIPEDSYLYSSAFTDCVNHRKLQSPKATEYARTLRLKVRAPQLRSNERLAIIGDSDTLGRWDATKAVDMTEHNHNEWVVDLNADAIGKRQLEFKFAALDEKIDYTPLWESSNNRVITISDMQEGDVVVYELDEAFFPIYDTKLAGTLVPVFSLRSKTSFGVGDFGDLKKMIDFISSTGQRILQILPINDTTITHTWTDSYPYSCISIFALHPQYVDLTKLPELADAEARKKFSDLQKELNALPQIDYERVNQCENGIPAPALRPGGQRGDGVDGLQDLLQRVRAVACSLCAILPSARSVRNGRLLAVAGSSRLGRE
jgi:4-alpha-glucanotransferase